MPNRRELGYVSAGSTSTVFVSTGIYGRATGGIGSPTAVTIGSTNYEYLTFNATGTLTVTTAGWFDYLAVGGGGGAAKFSNGAGGGGSGCLEIGSIYLDANQTITIGAGGAFADSGVLHTAGNTIIAATSPFGRTIGGNFSINEANSLQNILAVGGGNGSSTNGTPKITFTTAYGRNGGDSTASTNGGGGGSVNNVGGNGSSTTGGAAAAGFDVSVFIGGSALFKAMGGGGGGSVTGGAAATDGVAGSATTTPPNGNANSGGGGGGGAGVLTTGNGGSGICYIRWSVA